VVYLFFDALAERVAAMRGRKPPALPVPQS
jgi:hypothetical protein